MGEIEGRFLYIAVGYFNLNTSVYASPREESTFAMLDNDICDFSWNGDLMLLGDFNARRAIIKLPSMILPRR